jgi:hypothetical protein
MSTSITVAFVKSYADDVKDAFQRQGSQLLNTVRYEPNVVGSTHTFFRIGKGTATTKARHGKVTPMNQTHNALEATLVDFYAGDWVDKLDENAISINERQALARGGAMALGRKIDEQITDAMDGTTETAISWTVTSATAVENALIEMAEALWANDVPNDGMAFGLLTPRSWSRAMKVESFASSDFIGSDNLPFRDGPASNMRMKSWNGINWMMHTGLPGSGTGTAKNFVYHQTAIGYASGQDVTAEITYNGEHVAHFVNHFMKGGCVLIEDAGVIEGTADDTANIATS